MSNIGTLGADKHGMQISMSRLWLLESIRTVMSIGRQVTVNISVLVDSKVGGCAQSDSDAICF